MSAAGAVLAALGPFGPPLAVVLLAASPLGEVRVAIPVAVLRFGMGWAEAVVWALIGNFGFVPILWWLLPKAERLARRWGPLDRGLDRIFERTRRRASKRVERSQEVALWAFIAIPLPGTGAWTATLVAYLFGLSWRQSWPYLYAGVTTACFVVVALVEAGVRLGSWVP